MTGINLVDLFTIELDEKYRNIKKSAKLRLMDNLLNNPEPSKRGLLVTFGLSSSARRINNRIYTPKGQRDGIPSWTVPYSKPIIRNHDRNEDPMGRIQSVEYVSNDQEAIRFFRTAQDFMAFKDAMESNEPKRIARAMNAKGLMTQEAWPGLGHLRAKAKIVHEDAIEKFLDQRYLTFSAGSHTDRYVCSTCFTDWASEAPCEHVPGTVDQDGNLTVFITGTFYGDEASVLTSPANDLSSVISLQMTDGSNQKVHLEKSVTDLDPYTIFTTDGRFEIESEDDPLEIPMNMDELVDKLLPLLLEKLKDSLAVAKEVEVEETVDTTSNQQEDAATEGASSDSNAESDVQVDSQTQTSVVDENSTSEDNVSVLTDSTSSVSLETLASAISEIQALLVTDRTAKQELDNQTKELQDLKNDYAQALQMVDSLKQEVQNLKQSVSVVDNKNSELENVDTAKSSFGSVEDPSESNAKTLIDTNTSDKKLDPFQARFVDRYKEINSIFGARKADAYIRQQKDRGFLPSNFKIQDFLKEND